MTISGATMVAGIMGWPVKHSRSPRLHGYWATKHDVDAVVVPFPVEPRRLESAIRGLVGLGLRGTCVTAPHKEGVAKLMDRLNDTATRTGAVNCVVVGSDGALEGYNNDVVGFIASLREQAPAWKPCDGPAMVIGAGGASRAVVYALVAAGVPEIRLVNRTPERGAALAEVVGGPIKIVDWVSRETALRDCGILVNTTTQGMRGNPALDLSLDPLPPSAVVNDIIYMPLETPLLAAARARGNAVVDGLGMLLHQGVPAFKSWFGIEPAVDGELRDFVLEGMRE